MAHIFSPCNDSSCLYTVGLLVQYSTERILTQRENINWFQSYEFNKISSKCISITLEQWEVEQTNFKKAVNF